MPGRKYNAGSGYRYGFNGKENDKDISEGGQDYGMRIYDGRLGRFLSVDPLTDDYPELTPYQFASDRPIDGIDLDGLEFSKEQLTKTLADARAAIQNLTSGNSAIATRGISNAMVNANTIGVSDWIGGTSNLDDYEDEGQRRAYLEGRLIGDCLSALQGLSEVSGAGTALTAAGAQALTGVGAISGGGTAIAAGFVGAHGAGVTATASSDIIWSLGKLATVSSTASGGAIGGGFGSTIKETVESNTNNQATAGQNKNNGSAQANTSSNGNAANSTKAQKGYRIKNTETGKYVKPGISGGKVRKDGVPYRATSQTNSWNKLTGRNTYSAEAAKNFRAGKGARQKALNWEAKDAARLKKQGHLQEPDKHKRPI